MAPGDRRGHRMFTLLAVLALSLTNPLTLGTPIHALAAPSGAQNTLQLNGHAISEVEGLRQQTTAYLPIRAVAAFLRKAGLPNRWTGRAWGIAVDGRLQFPANRGLGDPLVAVVIQSQVLARIPSITRGQTVYLAVPTIVSALAHVSVSARWDGSTLAVSSVRPGRLKIVPWGVAKVPDRPGRPSSQRAPSSRPSSVVAAVYGLPTPPPIPPLTPPPTPPVTPAHRVYTFAETYAGKTISLSDLAQHAGLLTDIASFDASITPTGGVLGRVPQDAQLLTQGTDVSLQLTVANLNDQGFERTLIHALLQSRHTAALLARNIVAVAKQNRVRGVNLDFEAIPPGDADRFNWFLALLAQRLHRAGQTLVVDVPAKTGQGAAQVYDGAYQYGNIAKVADAVVVMAYDYSYSGGPPGPIAPIWWVQQVAQYAAATMPRQKVLLGIPTYAYDWGGPTTRGYSLTAVARQLRTQNIRSNWNAAAQAPYYSYRDGQGQHTVYYENQASLTAKLRIAAQWHFGGVAFWRTGLESPDFWTLVRAYEAGTLPG